MKKYQLKIEGMHCEKCAKKVEDALHCKVNLKKKEALLKTDHLNEKELASKIEELGYQLLEIKEKKGLF